MQRKIYSDLINWKNTNEFMEDETKIIEVMVPEDQMKYVIGKGGKNAHALRTLVYAYAYIHKMHKIKLNIYIYKAKF